MSYEIKLTEVPAHSAAALRYRTSIAEIPHVFPPALGRLFGYLARDLRVRPCIACDSCKRGERCVVEDDMQGIYARLHSCDALVLATPLYYYAPTGWVKPIIDRLYSLSDIEGRPRLSPGKKLFVITTQEEEDEADGRAVVALLARSFAWPGLELASSLVVAGLGGGQELEQHPEYLASARQLIQ